MRNIIHFICFAALLFAACGTQTGTNTSTDSDSIATDQRLPGDSTLYGLACDGCTDSILVFLPYSGGDPDTFDIIDAFQQHRIYGRVHIGDELGIITNPDNPRQAQMVVNMESLKGTWCYMVIPTLRHSIDSTGKNVAQRFPAGMPDSIREKLFVPREYSLRLKRDNSASTRGDRHQQTNSMSIVEYPAIRHYTEWHLWNGRIILKADTIGGITADNEQPVSDTVDIRLLMRDSLILRFADHEQSYYRKKQSEEL